LEITQDGILGVTADADNVRETGFIAVDLVDALERLVFGVRQPVEADAALFGVGFSGEAGGALGLVGEIGMRLDQRKAKLRRRMVDSGLHRGE